MQRSSVAACCAVLLLSYSTAAAQSRTERLTDPVTSVDPDGGFFYAVLSLSGDGSIAMFVSSRSDLVPNDTNRTATTSGSDVFIRDVAAGATRRVMGVGGAQPNGEASFAMLTRDGRYVLFVSTATNLVENDPNGVTANTFRHDLLTGATTVLDVPTAYLEFSGNGRYIGYPIEGAVRFFDLQTGTATDILQDASPGYFQFNLDASVVAFISRSVPGLYEGSVGQLFVRDRVTSTYELISRRPDGEPGNGVSGVAHGYQSDGLAMSDDGRYIGFASAASDLVANDTNGVVDVFVHDRVTRVTTRVSVAATGGQRVEESLSLAISGDGAVIAFASSLPPLCAGCPALSDVAVYDRTLAAVRSVSVSTDGTPANLYAYQRQWPIALDRTGRYVVFESAANNLVPDDTLESTDVFLRDRGASPGCSYHISPTIDIAAAGGTATATLTTAPGCLWSVAVADPWIVASPTTGTGPSMVSFTIAANTGIARFGYVAVEGRRALVRQPGAQASAPPSFELIGLTPSGSPFEFGTNVAAISEDGRYVAFEATVRPAGSGQAITRVYLRDRTLRQTIDVSGAPGGPLDNPDIPQYLLAFTDDGRFVYFWPDDRSPIPGCLLFDRETGTSARLPDGLGYGRGSCPSMSATGRFFTGQLPDKSITLYDRTSQQRVEFPFPGLPAGDFIIEVFPSASGRYVVIVAWTRCFSSSRLDCLEEYTAVLDRQTGATSRTNSALRSDPIAPYRLRLQLLDPLWAEFGLPRFHTRWYLDGTFTACEMVDRHMGTRVVLPLLNSLTPGSLDCGLAVNHGQQIVFSSILPLSPGDSHQSTDLHVLTLSSGRAARLGTQNNGDVFNVRALAVSHNGRYLLGQSTPAPYSGNVRADIVVFDLGVLTDAPCSYTLTPTTYNATASAGSTGIAVTTTPACGWTATSNASWFSVNPPSGTGSATVTVSWTGNTTAQRNGTATIGGQTLTIVQAASSSCTISLSPLSYSAAASAGSTSVGVTTSSSCAWIATTTDSWLSASPASGIGSGTVTVSWTANTGTQRGGGVTIGGQTVGVTQAAGGTVPSNLTLTAVSGNIVTIAWSAPSGGTPTGYVLEGGVTTGSVLASLPTGGTAPAFSFTAPTGSFYIRVHALTGTTRSAPSNEIRIHVNVPAPPSSPTGLLGLADGSALALSWVNTAGGGSPTGILLNVSGAVTTNLMLPVTESFTFAGVPPGTYSFAVSAVNATGPSGASNQVTLTFPGACSGAPGTPTNFVVARSGNRVAVSWDPPASGSAVTGYTVIVTGSFVGNISTTTRGLAATAGPGTYTVGIAATNPCGTGTPTAAQTVIVP